MANIKSFLFLLSSFLVAILLIVEGPKWAERIGQKYDKQVVPQSKVAQVVTLEGSASRRRYGEDAFEGLVLGHWLHNLDTVQLQTRAKMHLTIGDYKLALQGPGLLIFELWQNEDPTGPLVLHLISGELYVLEDGKAGKLYVVRNGEMLDPKGKTPSPYAINDQRFRRDIRAELFALKSKTGPARFGFNHAGIE